MFAESKYLPLERLAVLADDIVFAFMPTERASWHY